MKTLVDSFFEGADFSRKLGLLALSGQAEFLSRSLDQFEALNSLGSGYFRQSWADAAALDDASQWKSSAQNGISRAIDLSRDIVLSMSSHQIELLGLLHDQADELQKFLSANLTRHLAHIEAVRPTSEPEAEAAPVARRRAA